MAKTTWLVFFLCMTLLFAACSDSDEEEESSTGPSLTVKGADLLGLVDGRTLEYVVSDTIIIWFPSYSVETDTCTQIIRISGEDNDWIIRDDNTLMLNLKVSDPFVLHNGYWRKVGQYDALIWFPVPAIAMDRSVSENQSWNGFVPVYTTDSGDMSFSFYYGYFGFHFTKTFAGLEEIFVPAYGGSAYRYDIKLFGKADDNDPLATVVEYYVANIGLVRQEFHAEGWTRVLSLRAYN